jgi:hypothetical protein
MQQVREVSPGRGAMNLLPPHPVTAVYLHETPNFSPPSAQAKKVKHLGRYRALVSQDGVLGSEGPGASSQVPHARATSDLWKLCPDAGLNLSHVDQRQSLAGLWGFGLRNERARPCPSEVDRGLSPQLLLASTVWGITELTYQRLGCTRCLINKMLKHRGFVLVSASEVLSCLLEARCLVSEGF